MRHSAQRPLPALFAIMLLVGVLVIASLILNGGAKQENQHAVLPDQESGEMAAE